MTRKKLLEKIENAERDIRIIKKELSDRLWGIENPPKFKYGDILVHKTHGLHMPTLRVLESKLRVSNYDDASPNWEYLIDDGFSIVSLTELHLSNLYKLKE
jgi:hypothetical protein